MHEQFNRTSIAWGELRMRKIDEDGLRAAGGLDDTIVAVWLGDTTARDVIRRGNRAIMATLKHHYLDFSYSQHPISNFWYDVSKRTERDQDPRQCARWIKKANTYIRGDVSLSYNE